MIKRDIGLEIVEGIKGNKGFQARQGQKPQESRTEQPRSSSEDTRQNGAIPGGVRTLQDWEQGRRQPSGPAESLLRIAEQDPGLLLSLA